MLFAKLHHQHFGCRQEKYKRKEKIFYSCMYSTSYVRLKKKKKAFGIKTAKS